MREYPSLGVVSVTPAGAPARLFRAVPALWWLLRRLAWRDSPSGPQYRRRGSVRRLTAHDFAKVLKPLGYKDKEERPIVTHGFRRTFRTWGSKVARARFEVLEVALAHLSSPSVRAYFDAETELIDERRELMQKWADYVLPREEDG